MPPIKISKLVVLPFEEEAMSLSAFHYLFLQLSLSLSLSYFQPIFVSFVPISSSNLTFSGMSLVEFYPDRAR